MRPALVPASMLTDVRGNNDKARALFAWEQQATRAVVSWLKPTGVSVDRTRAGHVLKASGLADTMKLAFPLSRRRPVEARHGVGNEHARSTETD
jgi:hypothetical protein